MELEGEIKKKRGRPKKGSQVKDVQGQVEHPKKDMNESLLLTDQNSNEKLLLYKMITEPKKRGRPKKEKCEIPKKDCTTELPKVDVPSVFQLCLENPLLDKEYNPCDSFPDIVLEEKTEDAALMMSAENVDPDQLIRSVEDVLLRDKQELIKEPNEADNASDICASIRRCSVKLERLVESEKQKYLNGSMDVKEPRVKPVEKRYLLENLGNFLRYKGSSTRGNFSNTFGLHSPDITNPWCLKFSDDSSDEDYLPGKQFPKDDLDWNPTVKSSVKRKSTSNIPAHTKVKRAKHNKVSAKLNNSSSDNLSLTSSDNSSNEIRSYDLYSSGKMDPLTKPEHVDVSPTQTNSCSSINLTRVTKMNPSRISWTKREPRLMAELQVTQSSTGLETKQEHSQCQVSQTRTCTSGKTIEVIDISSDLKEESMKTVLTNDCPSTTESTHISKHENLQIAPLKLETNLPILNVDDSRSFLKVQRKRTKSQIIRNSCCASNDSERVMNASEISIRQVTLKKQKTHLKSKKNVGKSSSSLKQQKYSKKQVSQMTRVNSLKIVPMRNDSQSIAESFDTRSPCDINFQRKQSKDKISRTGNSASNILTTDNIPEDNGSQIALMKGDSKLKTLNANKFQTILKKRNQPNGQVSQVCGLPSNRLINASGKKLKTVSMKQDNQMIPEVPAEKLLNIRKEEVSQISICSLNELVAFDNVSEEGSLQIALLKQNSNSKVEKSKQAPTMARYSVEHPESNVEVPFERRSYISNSLTNRSEQQVEDLSVSLTSDIFDECSAHCSFFSCNLDNDNAPAPLAGCIYCKNFAELDAIASLAAADLGEDPKAYIECQIESTESMYDKLKVEQPQDDEVALKLKKIALKNRSLKYGRDFLSNYGSFINVSEYFLKSIDLAVA